MIDCGIYANTVDLARAIGKDAPYVARTTRLALLALEIVHAALAGTLPRTVSMEQLRKGLPDRWAEQKRLFGISAFFLFRKDCEIS